MSKTFTLTDGQVKLLKEFFEELSIAQDNSGCNDWEVDNTDENWEMVHKIELEQFGDGAQDRPPPNENINTVDILVLSYLRNIMGI